ncbi:MAG: paraquat-inducible protein A [Pseudomonadota bacterium]
MIDSVEQTTERKDAPPRRPGPILDVLAEWALYASVALIIAGLVQPSLYKPGLFSGEDLSAFGIIATLWEDGEPALAAMIVLFAILFPLAKTVLAAILFRTGANVRERLASLMQFLGKWSMLDVFLAAFLIGFTQAASLFQVEARSGLYLFASGVILHNLATARLSFSRAS